MNSRPSSSKVSSRADEKRMRKISSSVSKSFFTPSNVPGAAPQDKQAPVKSRTRSRPWAASRTCETAMPPPWPSRAARTAPRRLRRAGTKWSVSTTERKGMFRRRSSSSGSVASATRRAASASMAAFASAAYLATKSSSMPKPRAVELQPSHAIKSSSFWLWACLVLALEDYIH